MSEDKCECDYEFDERNLFERFLRKKYDLNCDVVLNPKYEYQCYDLCSDARVLVYSYDPTEGGCYQVINKWNAIHFITPKEVIAYGLEEEDERDDYVYPDKYKDFI